MKRIICLTCLSLTIAATSFVPKTPARELTLDTLTVTAQKREENVQDIPISLDLFTEMNLENYGLEEMSHVVMQSANVFMKTNQAESPIIIRGISSFKSAIFSPAGFYVDDVSYSLSYMTNPDLLDVQRIEILKGPQGTLYGRNTLSGLVNVVTRQPDNQVRARLNLDLATYDTDNNGMRYRAGGSLAGPILSDRLFLGLAFQGLESDGFRTDIATDDDRTDKKRHLEGRGTLRFTPNPNLDISFTASGGDNRDGFGVYRLANGPDATQPHRVNSGDPGLGKDQQTNMQNLKISYKGAGWDLISISSRQAYEIDFISDMDFNGGPSYSGFKFEDAQWSQEIRIASSNPGRLTWLAGLYGFKEDTDTRLDIRRKTNTGSMELWHPEGEIDMTGYALFSQATWHFKSPWHLTAGLRLDHQELSGRVVNQQTAMMPFLPASLSFAKDLSYNEILPKLAIRYNLSQSASLYVTAAKGYQVGGYNYSMVMSPDTFTYDPEYAWNYEVGIKSGFLDNRIRINGSLFYVAIRDKQIDVNNPDAQGVPMAPDINNAGKVHTCGAELSIQADPLPGLNLFANLGFLKTEIDQWSYVSRTGTIDYQGNRLPYSPEFNFSLGSVYHLDNGLFLGGEVSGMSSYYGDPGNRMKQKAFELVNLRLGYESESFDLIFWCKNLFDKSYFTVMDEMMNTGVNKTVEGDPRILGVTFRYRF